ncbi:MAG: AsmA family protein [Gammaproteobacteria bacterium]|nr:MAG: AsmA family protein [Gammaproteobacteria bacterium]
MKFIKWLFYLLFGLVIFIVVAAVLVPLLFDINDYKPTIAEEVENRTGRAIGIEGDLKLTVFPWLGVETGALSLANAAGFGDEPMLTVDAAAVHVKLIPLIFDREFEINTIVLNAPRLHLIRNANGATNWEDLTGEDAGDSAAAAGGVAILTIGGIQIEDGQLVYEDRGTGQTTRLEAIEMDSSAIEFGEPSDVELSFDFKDGAGTDARITLATKLTVHLARKLLEAGDLELNIKGQAAGMTLDVSAEGALTVDAGTQTVTAPDLWISGETSMPDLDASFDLRGDVNANLTSWTVQVSGMTLHAQGQSGEQPFTVDARGKFNSKPDGHSLILEEFTAESELNGLPVSVAGPLRLFFKPDAQNFAADKLQLTWGTLRASGNATGRLSGDWRINTELQIMPFNPRQLLKDLDSDWETTDPDVLSTASGGITLNARAGSGTLKLKALNVDDSTLNGQISVNSFVGPDVSVQLEVDAINLDRYMPPSDEEAVATPTAAAAVGAAQLPVELLRSLILDGNIRIGSVTMTKLTATNMNFALAAADGILQITPTADFYSGKYRGDMRLDATGDTTRFSINERITGINAEPLTKDMLGEARIAGTGNLQMQVQGNADDPLRSATGNYEFGFTDGAVIGVNIGQLIRRGKALFEGRRATGDERGVQQTDFSELSLKGTLANGIMNGTVALKAPLLRIDGNGTINLEDGTVNALIKPVLVESSRGQGGAELADLSGIPIPIRVSGPVFSPSYSIDFAALIQEEATKTLQEELLKLLQPKKDRQRPAAQDDRDARDAERRKRREQGGGGP